MKLLRNPIFIITFLFIILSVLLFAQSSSFLIDFSREIYIPKRMISGEKLFKDIFLVYGFFGYFMNYFLYKINPSIFSLLLEANLISYFIVILFYFITKYILDKKTAFLFCLALIFCSVFSPAAFSFTTPYSYSTLWGYLACYAALFSVLYKHETILYLSLSLAAVSKTELFIALLIFVILYKLFSKEKITKKLLLILVFPVIFFIYAFIWHIQFADILKNISYIKKMAQTDAIFYFYKGMGVFFLKEYFLFNLKNTFLYLSAFVISCILFKKNKKIAAIVLLVFFFMISNVVFIYNLAVFILIGLFIFLLCKNKITKNDVILFSFSLILSLKSVFALNIFGYGNFSFVLVIFNIFLFLAKFLNKNYIKIHFTLFFLFLSAANIKNMIIEHKIPYKTLFGTVYLKPHDMEKFRQTNEFIENNVKNKEKLLVVPEGEIFNFINGKKWYFYNSTFTPLDFETFGDGYFIKNIDKNKIDYIVFYPRKTFDYKKGQICFDFGVDFCTYIVDNYDIIKTIEVDGITIFKRKNEK